MFVTARMIANTIQLFVTARMIANTIQLFAIIRTFLFVLQHYLDDVPLSRILTIENRVKQMAPKPVNTRAGIK